MITLVMFCLNAMKPAKHRQKATGTRLFPPSTVAKVNPALVFIPAPTLVFLDDGRGPSMPSQNDSWDPIWDSGSNGCWAVGRSMAAVLEASRVFLTVAWSCKVRMGVGGISGRVRSIVLWLLQFPLLLRPLLVIVTCHGACCPVEAQDDSEGL